MERVVMVAVALLSAGCLGGSGTHGSTSGIVAPASGPSDDLGTIEGLVVSDESLPIRGARIVLHGEFEALSSIDGRFVFAGVVPGAVDLVASMPGFMMAQESVDVAAGRVSHVTFILSRLPDDAPHMVSIPWQGAISCWVGVGIGGEGVLAGASTPCQSRGVGFQSQYEWNATLPSSGLHGIVMEAAWTPTQVLGTEMRLACILYIDQGDDVRLIADQFSSVLDGPKCPTVVGSSPLRIELSGADLCAYLEDWPGRDATYPDCDDEFAYEIHLQTFPNRSSLGPVLALDQRFENVLSEFYYQAAPGGFSALSDA